MSRWVIFLPISLLLSNLGCSTEAPKTIAGSQSANSSNRFEISNLELQEGSGEKIVWRAVAAEASGDLHETQVRQLTVTHKTESNDNTVVLKAPKGKLSPLSHDVFLQEATLQDSFERSMKMPTLAYDRSTETIQGTGPVEITGPGFSLTAAKLQYQLKDELLILSGPIQGEVSLASTRPQSAR